jgi:gamma-glutamylcyclotransferase (GGCT)/AIG2-like uncharacterized protein YtfP
MLVEKGLKNQDTFRKYVNGKWYSKDWEYMVSFEGNRTVLYKHCEVYGDTEELKTLDNLEDLKDTYELLTGEDFE